MKNNNKKALKIILWTIFALVVLAGVAYASWYFLINPETRAGGANDVERVKLTAKSQEWWATSAYQTGAANKKAAEGVWNIAKRDPDNRVITLRQAIDRGWITGHKPNHNLDEFKFALYERTRDLEIDVPRFKDTYSVGKIATAHEGGTILTHADDVVDTTKFPGTAYNKGTAPSGFTIWSTTSNKSTVKPKLSYSDPDDFWYSNGSRFRYDNRQSIKPTWNAYPGNTSNQNTWISGNRMVSVTYTGSNQVTLDNQKGTNAEITMAYKDLSGSYRWNKRQGLKERTTYDHPNPDFKNDKVVLEFKAKNTKSNPNITKGENLFVIPTLSANGTDSEWKEEKYNKSGAMYTMAFDDESSPAEYRYNKEIGSAGYAYDKGKDFYNLARVSPQNFVKGIYRDIWETNGKEYEYIRAGLSSHEVSDLVGGFVTDSAKQKKMGDLLKSYPKNFGAWQNPGEGNNVIAERFRVGNTSVEFSSGGLSGRIYPVAVVPGSIKDPNIDNYVRFVWALRIDDGGTKKVTFSKDTNSQAIRNLLRPYRTAISVMSLNDYIFRGNYGYNRVTKKLSKIASVDITSDPLNEVGPGELGKVGRETDTTKAALVNDQKDAKITWEWKNGIKPKEYRIHRGKTKDFAPNNDNKIGTRSSVDNLEYIDSPAPVLKENPKQYYWYRVVAIFQDGKLSRPSIGVTPTVTEVSEPPQEGQAPLKPTDVDAFGLPKQIELTWKAGVAVKSIEESETKTKTVKGESVTKGSGSHKFDIYRATVDPSPQSEAVSSIFGSLVKTANAATKSASSKSATWEKIASNIATVNDEGKYIYYDKNLKNGKKYWYRVIEVNQYGQSPASSHDMDIPHEHEDVTKDGYVSWDDVTRVLIYPENLGKKIPSRDVTEDVNDDNRVNWTDIYGSSTKRGILKYPTFPEIIPVKSLSN